MRGFRAQGGLGPDRNHGGADMTQAKTWVGLDVHVSGTIAAVLDHDSGELCRRRLSGRGQEIAAFVVGFAKLGLHRRGDLRAALSEGSEPGGGRIEAS